MLLFAASLYYYPFQSLHMFNSLHQIYTSVTLFVDFFSTHVHVTVVLNTLRTGDADLRF